MAWTSVKEQGHLATSSAGIGEKVAKRIFIAISDTPTTPVAAETASDGVTTIPIENASHPSDSNRKVKSITATCDPESPRKIFRVEVEYSSLVGDLASNPLDDPDRFEWTGSESTEVYTTDKTSPTPLPVVNTAGQPFEQPLERDAGDIMCTVVRNLASFPLATAIACRNKKNSDSFTLDGVTIAIGEAKMGLITSGPEQIRNGVPYREVRYPIKFRPSWDDEIDSYGFQEKVGGVLYPIVDRAGNQVQRPWPLDAAGEKGYLPETPAASTVFKPYEEMTYSGFSFA
jgi:hypothetical protein